MSGERVLSDEAGAAMLRWLLNALCSHSKVVVWGVIIGSRRVDDKDDSGRRRRRGQCETVIAVRKDA